MEPMKRVDHVRIQLVREASIPYRATVLGPNVAYHEILDHICGDSDREHCVAIHLDHKHRVMSVETVAVGTSSYCVVGMKELFRGALLAGASAIVIGHNHPSGISTPSPDDIALTRRVIDASKIIGIKVLDHLVIGDGGFTSIRETSPDLGWE